MVNRELLEKFQRIYKEEFNVTITDEEATEMATELVNLMKVLVKPDPILEPDNTNNQLGEGELDEVSRILNK